MRRRPGPRRGRGCARRALVAARSPGAFVCRRSSSRRPPPRPPARRASSAPPTRPTRSCASPGAARSAGSARRAAATAVCRATAAPARATTAAPAAPASRDVPEGTMTPCENDADCGGTTCGTGTGLFDFSDRCDGGIGPVVVTRLAPATASASPARRRARSAPTPASARGPTASTTASSPTILSPRGPRRLERGVHLRRARGASGAGKSVGAVHVGERAELRFLATIDSRAAKGRPLRGGGARAGGLLQGTGGLAARVPSALS
jgi:hypothetical protein